MYQSRRSKHTDHCQPPPFKSNRSNTGVVDIYEHDGTGGNCRLLKALVPPQRSRHTNVKLTCVKLGPRDKMLAMGNILGAVNVILLDFGDGGAKAQRMAHSHAHHQVKQMTDTDTVGSGKQRR